MKFYYKSKIPACASDVFAWHEQEGAFEKLTPPWENVTVESHTGIHNGAHVHLRLKIGPINVKWHLTHQNYVKGQQFEDVQVSGPFTSWKHTHRMIPIDAHSSYLEETIEYKLPFGFLGRVMGGWYSTRKLEKLFAFRHKVTIEEFISNNL